MHHLLSNIIFDTNNYNEIVPPLPRLSAKTDALPFDKSLIRTWKNNDEQIEATLVKIEKDREANLYKLTVLQKGESFMANSENFIAWIILLTEKKSGTTGNKRSCQQRQLLYLSFCNEWKSTYHT